MVLRTKGAFIILRLMMLEIIIILILIKSSYSLRCRTDDGPTDGELKRVARSCMRKFSDNAFSHKTQQQSTNRNGQRVMNRESYGYNYEDSDEGSDDEDFEDQYYNNNNNNFNNRNYNRQQNGNSNSNHERTNNNNAGGGYNDDRQRNRSRYNGNNNNNNSNDRTNNGNSNINWNFSNQRNNMGSSSNSNNNRGNNNNNNNNSNRNKNNNNNNQNNNSSTDASCIVHCFFEEMHMLNNNNYPDRHKMLYILTKDLRDRELRNFYTDTIQECFRYLENQKKRDTCQYSRDLITCMTEYAKGNCDDWNEFNVMFN